MYETILVPTDGSDHAIRAAHHAAALAELFDATVHVLSVVDIKAATRPFDRSQVDDAVIERLEAAGDDSIDAVQRAVADTDRVVTERVRGRPASAILEYVDEQGIDLVAMGTHGRTGIERYVAGSVTERVVRESDVPVLSVRATDGHPAGEYDDILVPTDGSECATVAIDHALAIGERTDARIHAVNVVDVGALAPNADETVLADVAASLEAAGESATDVVANRAREAGHAVATEVREGTPARDVLRYADGNDIDLIAMGTLGRTGLNRFLLGSTTERVIRHAPMPVLAVTPPDE